MITGGDQQTHSIMKNLKVKYGTIGCIQCQVTALDEIRGYKIHITRWWFQALFREMWS